MLHGNVELHNIEQVTPAEDGGVWLQRLPDEVRLKLNEGAQGQALSPGCAEVRFVADSGRARVTLASAEATRVSVFHGRFGTGEVHTVGPEPKTIDLTRSENLDVAMASHFGDMPFDPRVFRVVLGGGRVRLLSVEGDNIRPAEPAQLPGIRLLTYGTSITHEYSASAPHLCYAAQAAWALGADLINLGLAGSCHAENEMADYMAERRDWTIASLALSVNMRGFAADEYARRLEYMVDRVAGADTSRPVVCVTLWPYFDDLGSPWANDESVIGADRMRQILRDAVAKAGHPNLHLAEGPEILTDFGGLTGDLIHPADNAMIEMGRGLAERLKPLCR